MPKPLSVEIGIGLPNPGVFSLTREIDRNGITPPSNDYLARKYPSKGERLRALRSEGGMETSAISGVVMKGLGQRVKRNAASRSPDGLIVNMNPPDQKPNYQPIDLTDNQFVQGQHKHRDVFRLLATGMTTTFKKDFGDQMSELRRQSRTSPDSPIASTLLRAEAIEAVEMGKPARKRDLATKLEQNVLDNIDSASISLAAIVRILPYLMAKDYGFERSANIIPVYQQVLNASWSFIRDLSLMPSSLTRVIGERVLQDLGSTDRELGLWEGILMLEDPSALTGLFQLRMSSVAGRDVVTLDFSEGFKNVLNTYSAFFGIHDGDWFGCPGMRAFDHVPGQEDPSLVNKDMWDMFVQLSPKAYSLMFS